jgi:Xaa-Pro aminopeptidase
MNDFGIVEKLIAGLERSRFDGILVAGPDNVQYLSGIHLPFSWVRNDQNVLVLARKSGAITVFCPEEWESSIRRSTWIEDVKGIPTLPGDSTALAEEMASTIQSSKISSLGLDFARIPQRLYESLVKALPGKHGDSCDGFLRSLRMIKTDREIEKLADAALRTDHAINGCIHHVTVDRRMSELTLAEELRVHSLETGLDLAGYNVCSHVAAGEELALYWPNTPKFGYAMTKDLQAGDTVRLELMNTLNGYWSDAARVMVMSQTLTPQQAQGYGYLVAMRENILQSLKPGARCSDVFSTAKAFAEQNDIPVLADNGVGHGIGLRPVEPPYLSASDHTELRANMVLVLDPIVSSEVGLLRSKDSVVITEEGAEIINWYKDWREPYTPILSI